MSNRKAIKRLGAKQNKKRTKPENVFVVEVDWHQSGDWYQRDNQACGSFDYCKGWADCWRELVPDMPVRIVKATYDFDELIPTDSVVYCHQPNG